MFFHISLLHRCLEQIHWIPFHWINGIAPCWRVILLQEDKVILESKRCEEFAISEWNIIWQGNSIRWYPLLYFHLGRMKFISLFIRLTWIVHLRMAIYSLSLVIPQLNHSFARWHGCLFYLKSSQTFIKIFNRFSITMLCVFFLFLTFFLLSLFINISVCQANPKQQHIFEIKKVNKFPWIYDF